MVTISAVTWREYAQSLCTFVGKKPEIHGDLSNLLRMPSRQVKQFGFGAKKDKYTILLFGLYDYLAHESRLNWNFFVNLPM